MKEKKQFSPSNMSYNRAVMLCLCTAVTRDLTTALDSDKTHNIQGSGGSESAHGDIRFVRHDGRNESTLVENSIRHRELPSEDYWNTPAVTNLATARSTRYGGAWPFTPTAITTIAVLSTDGLIQIVANGSEVESWDLTKARLSGVGRPSFFASARGTSTTVRADDGEVGAVAVRGRRISVKWAATRRHVWNSEELPGLKTRAPTISIAPALSKPILEGLHRLLGLEAVHDMRGFAPTDIVVPQRRRASGRARRGLPTYSEAPSLSPLQNGMRSVSAGQVKDKRKTVAIVALDEAGEDAARFVVNNAWPVKYDPSDYNAKSNEVAIELLELTHEGYERVR